MTQKKIWFALAIAVTYLGIAKYEAFSKSNAGQAAVPFLLISPDSRGSGMGECGTAVSDDVNAVFWNPAGLGFHGEFDPDAVNTKTGVVPWNQVSINFAKWLPQFNADLYYSRATYGRYMDEINGSFAINFTLMNLGEFTRTNDQGTVLGKFNSNEYCFGVSYGTVIATDLAWGFQGKLIVSDIAPSSSSSSKDGSGEGVSGGFDLGFLYKPQNLKLFGWDAKDFFSIGVNLQNVGPKVTYRKASDPLPTQLRIGTAFKVFEDEYNSLQFVCDAAKLLVNRDGDNSDPLPKSLVTGWKNAGMQTSFGSEYWYDKTVAFRAGYFTEPTTAGNRRYWNFGLGIKYDIFNVDMSFINTVEENNPLANTMRFSLMINFD